MEGWKEDCAREKKRKEGKKENRERTGVTNWPTLAIFYPCLSIPFPWDMGKGMGKGMGTDM